MSDLTKGPYGPFFRLLLLPYIGVFVSFYSLKVTLMLTVCTKRYTNVHPFLIVPVVIL